MSDSPEYVPLAKENKKMSIERIYQKKTQLEHILLRPDTYIGSVEPVTQLMWVYDGEEEGLVHREVTYVPGLYKIFDEIIVNAADNKQRSPHMDTIKIDIDPDKNEIRVYNNGTGIPVVQHKVEKMFVPSLIFGHLLTSSNYNDEEKKVTGGRNGFGAKLCNIFSKKFCVETSHKESGNHFKQIWKDNMTSTNEPSINNAKGEDFTSIKFSPDLQKFKMEKLDKDIVGLFSRRAFDVAGTTKNVKVYLNGKRLPIKGFKDYVEWHLKGKLDEQGNPLKVTYEQANDRWEVALTCSDGGLQQVSFVNSIATTKGGRHVEHVLDLVTERIIDVVRKKSKKEAFTIKPFQVKNHMWVFVNCLIVNPTFDSQTKEQMTLQLKSFGSKCTLSDKFLSAIQKSGIVESILSWVQFKSQTQLNKKCSARNITNLHLPKLDDANDAGSKHGVDCTLILTEGDSAKTLAVAGLGVIGRDRYGVFPLRGKLLNVREATTKQIMDNAEINNIIKIVGLQYKKKYERLEDLNSLRYGKIMIMTDQDQDGSHIKGLLINFIHHNWPGLIKLQFLEEFITPIVKARKGQASKSFYSLPEFEEWKHGCGDWQTWKIKYYKGLGTSTSQEAKEYFKDMNRHRIKFKYAGGEDDNFIQLAFSKKMIEQRKEWLSNGMEERKRRKELGLPEMYLYGKATTTVSYQDFVNKELILFSNMDNERSIPSIVDGFKPGQRKVLFTCFKRKKGEVKVAQLSGSVAELSAYHHGEVSLMATIINLAQNFVGSNNLNLLLPIGQFGTRLHGGKDSASARYIFTKLSPLARHIFNTDDDYLLKYLNEDNQKIEPEWYIPIIPMVLVNGADGIGTGWMTKIPNYDVREIVANLRRLINGEEPRSMIPSYKNFRGTIEQVEPQKFVSCGVVSTLDYTTFEITELPVRQWTVPYKENVLDALRGNSKSATEKANSIIADYKEHTTDTTVRFVVTMNEDKSEKVISDGLHKTFKLYSTFTTSSMVLFDHNGVLRKYDDACEILREFYVLRLEYYEKRKRFKEGLLGSELKKLSNQARFIVEKISGEIVVENKRKAVILSELIAKKYDPDPVKKWKETSLPDEILDNSDGADGDSEEAKSTPEVEKASDFDYLMCMTFWHITREKKDSILKEKEQKEAELNILKRKSPSDLWIEDLDSFSIALDDFERQERADEEKEFKKQVKAPGRAKKDKHAGTTPSASGVLVKPDIERDTKKKVEKSTSHDGAKKGRKKKEDSSAMETQDNSSEDEIKPLRERLAVSDQNKTTKKAMKQSTLSFEPSKKTEAAGKKKKKLDDSDSDVHFVSQSDSDDFMASPPKKVRTTVEEQSTLFDSLISNSDSAVKGNSDENANGNAVHHYSSDSDVNDKNGAVSGTKPKASGKLGATSATGAAAKRPNPPKKRAPKKQFDSGSDEDGPPKKKRAPAKKRNDGGSGDDGQPKKKRGPKKTQKALDLSSDDDFDDYEKSPTKPGKRIMENLNESSDFDMPRARSARSRAPVSYTIDSDESY